MNVQNFNSLQDIYGISKNFKLNMRKKNTIRLNESQLHNMISESVKQVLSELDWKTKMNYAQGRARQGDEAYRRGDEQSARKYWDKASDGTYAARDEFEKKYNPNGGDAYSIADIYDNGRGDIYTSYQKQGGNKNDRGFNYVSKNGDGFEYGLDDNNLQYYEGKPTYDKVKKMNQDVRDYKSGKSQYVKGKGWQ